MRAVKGSGTGPERVVRRLVWELGARYRLYRRDLPGKPDLVFPGRGLALFVHGCFWHGHDCARGDRRPTANAGYWRDKIVGNQARDARTVQALAALGWRSEIVWECELRDLEALRLRLKAILFP